MKNLGKKGQAWAKARAKLKKEFWDKGITTCEVLLPGRKINCFLSFAHRKKRREYYSEPEKLGDFNSVLLCCSVCHQQLEASRELTDKIFKKLRP